MFRRTILNAGKNETFDRGSLYRESLIHGCERYQTFCGATPDWVADYACYT
jgi:hypothetical protein